MRFAVEFKHVIFTGVVVMRNKLLFLLFISVILIFVGCSKNERVVIQNIEDLGNDGVRISIGDSKHVPAGKYAEGIIDNLSKENSELAERIRSNIVSKEVNVRAVLDKVVSKEVDAGFVYRTDAYTEKEKIKIIEIPDDINITAKYPIAVLDKSDNKKAAENFMEFVLSKQGQSILANYGFVAISDEGESYQPVNIEEELVVYAAASLTDAFNEISSEFKKATGCDVKVMFASSGSLRQKIQAGAVGGEAGADVFASASLKHMQILQEERIVESYEIFCENEMVIVTAK
ncbi:molybdate ABC transporter substrate-binding protein [Peptococcaceae bacterium]|nr:molybdate ABC transporter substrate-binding protein [Peptococcaceae bacterium]